MQYSTIGLLRNVLLWSACALFMRDGVAAPVASSQAQEAIKSYLLRWQAETGAPGVSAAVAVNGQIVFSGGVGLSDLQSATPQDGRSVHNLGSLSSVMSAVATMQLVERGKIKLDAPVHDYVPWYPRRANPVTLRHVLSHSSGIRDYSYEGDEFGPGNVLWFRQFDNFEESTRGWRDDPLLFEPGTRWMQSTVAPNLIQAVIEAVTGESFESYLSKNVWQPAGMADTRFDVTSRIVPRRGRGYVRSESGELRNAPDENVSYKYAAAGVLSTDEDLCLFGIALNSGRLLKPESLREMYRLQLPSDIRYSPADEASYAKDHPGQVRPSRGLRQAMFFQLDRRDDGVSVGRSGSLKGAESRFTNYHQDNVVVALHFNVQDAGGAVDLADAAAALARLYLPSRSGSVR
ncbi:serine hydrolase domain-containing protein [Steroidobacter sp.]|uniref:serine hydrolase domain-containing protein n=1 Tax=Steroidobacter sp. TaxID=1978227 RepID=UPI001A570CB6|nr:serine hydrolase domain-containing protein [Steroidobacter sp.]MBL8266348.1 beta-lactamase family protein [Steroidobacter sp.]